jgi:hypothetical protein
LVLGEANEELESAEHRRPKNDARENLADDGRLADFAKEHAEQPRNTDNDAQLNEHHHQPRFTRYFRQRQEVQGSLRHEDMIDVRSLPWKSLNVVKIAQLIKDQIIPYAAATHSAGSAVAVQR